MMKAGDFDECFDDVDVDVDDDDDDDDDDNGDMGSHLHLIHPMLKRIQFYRNPLSQNRKKENKPTKEEEDQIRWKSMRVLFLFV